MDISVINSEMKGEEWDDEYVLSNKLLFELYIEEYSLVKHLRKMMLSDTGGGTRLPEIVNREDLECNIRKELSSYDVGTLGGKMYMFGQVNSMLAEMLNDFDEKKQSDFIGYKELEQYHTLASTILQMLPEIIMGDITNSSENDN